MQQIQKTVIIMIIADPIIAGAARGGKYDEPFPFIAARCVSSFPRPEEGGGYAIACDTAAGFCANENIADCTLKDGVLSVPDGNGKVTMLLTRADSAE